VPDGTPFEVHKLAVILSASPLAARVFWGGAVLALGLLCYRWVRLAPLYRNLYESCELEAATECTDLTRIFEDLVVQAFGQRGWFPRPRLLIVRDAPYAAFTMGICPPIVVLSAVAARALGKRELTGILAHELGHVRRLDYLGRWLATILRDLMIWNPFVLAWYRRLIAEQEKACDEYAAALLDDPEAVASGLVEIGAYLQGLPVVSLGPLAARHKRNDLGVLGKRVDYLEERFVRLNHRVQWPQPLAYLVLILFLVAQPRVALSFSDIVRLLWHTL
jgi:Zn-dependent protease with chaperone function